MPHPRLTCSSSQELDAQVINVIEEYKQKLETRTDHHMG